MFDNLVMLILYLLNTGHTQEVSVEYSQFSKGVVWVCQVKNLKVEAYVGIDKFLIKGDPDLVNWLEPLLKDLEKAPNLLEEKAISILQRLEEWPS